MSAEQVQLSHAGRSVENLAIVLQLQTQMHDYLLYAAMEGLIQ